MPNSLKLVNYYILSNAPQKIRQWALKDNGNVNENVIPKYDFMIIPCCSTCIIQANYPVTGWLRLFLK